MFTGIIKYLGTVVATGRRGDLSLSVQAADLLRDGIAAGDSIAVNGVCLTVTKLSAGGSMTGRFDADVSSETLAVTTLGELEVGDSVNLEPALAVGDRLGGHFVSGHVDGVGTVRSLRRDERSLRLGIELPPGLMHYVTRKGSLCVDGVSLTINAVSGTQVELNIIPHTAAVTNIGGYKAGTRINIEVDLLARYLEGLLRGEHAGRAGSTAGLTREFLKAHGYA